MTYKQQLLLSKKLNNLHAELIQIKDPEAQRQIMQAAKLIYCAEKILSRKELIKFGQKEGDK